ncbi:MAG: hypothetical protein ABI673_09515 [Novosphingobium sp.]
MKTVLASVFSAVVAGLVLFLAQNWWADNQNAGKQKIRFDKISSFELTKDQLNDLTKKLDGFRNATITIYDSKNIGREDIADSSFSGPISDAIGFASINYPNGNPKNADINFDGKVLSVKYKLLPRCRAHILGGKL